MQPHNWSAAVLPACQTAAQLLWMHACTGSQEGTSTDQLSTAVMPSSRHAGSFALGDARYAPRPAFHGHACQWPLLLSAAKSDGQWCSTGQGPVTHKPLP